MTATPDLADKLASGERAVFHGSPGAAVAPLTEALALASAAGRPAEAAAATWLLGVALGACGRYGEAFTTLAPLVADLPETPELKLFGGLAAATLGSVHRQLGRHADGRECDLLGLALLVPLGPAALEARVDCAVGLAADAVGLGELDEAGARQAEAERYAEGLPAASWRPRVRLGWVRAEVALLADDPAAAVAAATESVALAEQARAPRHVAKGLLFLGVAQAQSGDLAAVATLRRAATLAEGLGCLPLVWPARAVLGALLAAGAGGGGSADREESDRNLSAARAAVLTIAGGIEEPARSEWLARPDVAALLVG